MCCWLLHIETVEGISVLEMCTNSLAIRTEKPVYLVCTKVFREFARFYPRLCNLGQMGVKSQMFPTFSWKCKAIQVSKSETTLVL